MGVRTIWAGSVWRWVGLLGALILAAPSAAHAAQGDPQSVTFSNLVVRLDKEDEIGLARPDLRVMILERLRALGLPAVGAESLVFEQDRSDEARFVIGGTVRGLQCRKRYSDLEACRVAIEWELFDRRREAVVYRAMTKYAVHGLAKIPGPTVAKHLVLGALERLARRERFRTALAADGALHEDRRYATATFATCPPLAAALPEATAAVLDASVVIERDQGHGSGFFVTQDGLLLTAAHVVSGSKVSVRMRNGRQLEARVLRVADNADVALLEASDAGGAVVPTPCVPLRVDPVAIGTELYAVGAPLARELSFTMTRGIASGVRVLDTTEWLQTDAAVNAGNSGGPLLDARGAAVAVTSFKAAGVAVEGLAFGAPMATVLAALGLKQDARTDWQALRASPAPSGPARKASVVVDAADPNPSLDPAADRRRAEERREERRERKRDEMTPTYVKVMFWGGLSVAAAGAFGVLWSYTRYDAESTTRADFEDARLANDLSWIAVGVGTTSFIASFVLRPGLPDATPDEPESRVAWGVGPGSATLRVRY